MSLAALLVASFAMLRPAVAEDLGGPGSGQFAILGGAEAVPMPLERTSVEAHVSGIGARVTVRQRFANPSRTPVEAVYTFPLPHDAAVDRMSLQIGTRVIEGEIKERNEARRIYESAKAQGQVAALLDQERANVFTQSVANIMPGAKIDVVISYVQTLKYDGGEYEFLFPMVVGPRFMPSGTKDPDKIAPPITPKGTRSGQTIDLKVLLDAGAPIREMRSVLHSVDTRQVNPSHRVVTLNRRDEIPNRDFILRYRVATESVTSEVLTQFETRHGGHVGLILVPPKAPTAAQIRPKEVIFVMDQSGSQSGFPIEKSKELTLKLIRTLRPNDTFNVMGFNTSVRALWSEPRPRTPENLVEAERFVNAMQANGGTMIREGVVAALANQSDPSRLRIVLFNTDGYVGDEPLVLKAIKENRDRARMFVFGIGNSVNRYLIESMSEEGRGASEIVTLNAKADEAVGRFVRRLERPVLTDVTLTINGVVVTDLEPRVLPDVFDDSPVVVYGRYRKPGTGTVTLRGKVGEREWSQTLPLNLTVSPGASALPALWARRRVEALERRKFMSQVLDGEPVPERQILDLALDYGMMSAYTSFVAVEQRIVNVGGKQRKVRVPVEMPDGVSYDGIAGKSESRTRSVFAGTALKSAPSGGRGAGGRGGGGFGGGGAIGGYPGGPANQLAPEALRGVQYINYDPTDNSLVIKGDPETKIAKPLLNKKGIVEVQIILTKLSDVELKALKELGFKLEEKDAKLKVVFGTVDSAKLRKIAALGYVYRIEPIE